MNKLSTSTRLTCDNSPKSYASRFDRYFIWTRHVLTSCHYCNPNEPLDTSGCIRYFCHIQMQNKPSRSCVCRCCLHLCFRLSPCTHPWSAAAATSIQPSSRRCTMSVERAERETRRDERAHTLPQPSTRVAVGPASTDSVRRSPTTAPQWAPLTPFTLYTVLHTYTHTVLHRLCSRCTLASTQRNVGQASRCSCHAVDPSHRSRRPG